MSELVEKTLPGLHSSLIGHVRDIPRSARVLDIGSGSGAWLERLAGEGFSDLHGIDQDIEQFRCGRATCSRANLDHDDLALGDRRFDLITAIELVEHLENPGRLYKHIGTYLAPGGVALITTPNIHSLISRLRHLLTGKLGQFDEKSDETHVMPLLLLGLERILSRHGLKIVRRWGHPEQGSVSYRKPLVVAARLLRAVLPDEVPGDIVCLFIQRA